MPYLTLNGVTVPVAVEGASMSYVDVGGEQDRSTSGELAGGPSTTKREWRMTMARPVPVSELDAWVGLIEGKGHTFPLDAGLYSARGRGTSAGSASLITSGMKWGAGCIEVASGTSVQWNLGLGSAWTLLWWSNDQGVDGWGHWLTRSDEETWRNGAASSVGSLLMEAYVVGTNVVLTGTEGADWLIDDVVALPYVVPASWAAGMYTRHAASAWTPLPRVLAGGSFAPSPVVVRGKVTGTRIVRAAIDGTLQSGHVLEFTLREV